MMLYTLGSREFFVLVWLEKYFTTTEAAYITIGVLAGLHGFSIIYDWKKKNYIEKDRLLYGVWSFICIAFVFLGVILFTYNMAIYGVIAIFLVLAAPFYIETKLTKKLNKK